jgi:hypothetical protein
MSPARTLKSWGSSSSDQRRRTRPTGVMRGSCRSLMQMPSRSLSACTSARRASASRYIDRNLIILKVRAVLADARLHEEDRSGESSRRTASPMSRRPGQIIARSRTVRTMSNARLAPVPAVSGSGWAGSRVVRLMAVSPADEVGSGSDGKPGIPRQGIAHRRDAAVAGQGVETVDLPEDGGLRSVGCRARTPTSEAERTNWQDRRSFRLPPDTMIASNSCRYRSSAARTMGADTALS